MDDLIQFTPTDASREKYRVLAELLQLRYMDEFFDLWEKQGDQRPESPREAGTIVAHALIDMAARIAVFGTHCSGREPVIEQWRAVCDDHFNKAVADVAKAFEVADDAG